MNGSPRPLAAADAPRIRARRSVAEQIERQLHFWRALTVSPSAVHVEIEALALDRASFLDRRRASDQHGGRMAA